jgi:hypothetical protein
MLRIQINANHEEADIDRLLTAMEEMRGEFPLPKRSAEIAN